MNMETETKLFTPYELSDVKLPSRLVMSPMGRRRADDEGTPTELMVEYYRQRAAYGLVVTESTHPSPEGRHQPKSPYLYTQEDADAWARVTSAVHGEGGSVFLQLMHAGITAHPSVNGGHQPVGPSAVRPQPTTKVGDDVVDHPVPRAVTEDDMERIIAAYVSSAGYAVEAGFDGVELHVGNGFLPHQFLASGSNRRTDGYGGPPPERCRFVTELAGAVAGAVGPERVGFKISPGFSVNGISEEEIIETYGHLLNLPEIRELAYCHTSGFSDPAVLELIKESWEGTWIHNALTDPASSSAEVRSHLSAALENGADLVSVGRSFIANPDLLDRLANDRALAVPDPATFYTGDETGYVDY